MIILATIISSLCFKYPLRKLLNGHRTACSATSHCPTQWWHCSKVHIHAFTKPRWFKCGCHDRLEPRAGDTRARKEKHIIIIDNDSVRERQGIRALNPLIAIPSVLTPSSYITLRTWELRTVKDPMTCWKFKKISAATHRRCWSM